MTDLALDEALLRAHELNNTDDLVRLYTLAGDAKEREDDIDGACFYRTQAYIFALESGNDAVQALNERLVQHGREEPLVI